MSWKDTWKTIFFPEFDSGGLSLTRDQVAVRIFENAESPSTTGTLAAAWTGTNVTVTRETTAPLNGEGSVKVAVAGGAGSVFKAFDRAKFGYPFPGHNGIRIRYVKFRATCSAGSGPLNLVFKDNAGTFSKSWAFTVEQDKTVELVVDLDPDNTESFPAPTTVGTWDPELVDRFGFSGLTSGLSYYFDDIEFLYEYSLMDILGFPTEAPVDMGDVGSINAKINGLWANVKALEGRTYQYDKVSPNEMEVGDEGVWALELLSDFAPPTTTEIILGVYQIDRVRHGGTTNIVAPTVLQKLAGSMYMTYQPGEDNWTEGDLIKVTFSKGTGALIADEYCIKTDEDPSNALTAAGVDTENHVNVANAYEYQVGWQVRLKDGRSGTIDSLPGGNDIVTTAGDPHFAADDVGKTILNVTDGTSTTISAYVSEHRVTLAGLVGFNVAHAWEMSVTQYLTVDSLPDPTTVQFTGVLTENYPLPSTLLRVIQTDLDTAVFYTRLTREPMIEFEGNSFFETDREDGAYAHALPNSHWGEGVYKLGAAGTQSALIAGGKIVVSQSVAAGDYAAKNLYSIKSKYFRVVVDLDVAFTTPGTGSTAGLAMVKGTAYAAGNNVEVYRFNDGTDDHIVSKITLGGAGGVEVPVDTTDDDAVALMIERNDRTWRTWYSLTKFPDYEWVLLEEANDTADAFGEQSSAFLFAGTADAAGVIVASFDNYKYIIDSKFLEQMYDSPEIVPIVDKQVDPRVNQNTATGLEIFRVGLMDIRNGLPTTAEITPGTTLVDRYREGTDAGWITTADVITNDEANGYISALYDFPAAHWKPGDQARMTLSGVVVTDAVTGRVYNVPNLAIYFIVGGPPEADDQQNLWLGDVIGNKVDKAQPIEADTVSLLGYAKAAITRGMDALFGRCNADMAASTTTIVSDDLVGYGDNAFNTGYQMVILRSTATPGVAPEMEMRDITAYVSDTGTFTVEAFSAQVKLNDLILIVSNAMASMVSAYGIADAASGVSNVRDAARTEANNWWNGQQLMMLSGLARGQVRPIYDFTTGVDLLVSPAFDAVPAAGDVYVIIPRYTEIVPRTIDDTQNELTSQVIGRKDDTTVPKVGAAKTAMGYLKGIAARGMAVLQGTVTAGVVSTTDFGSTDLVGYPDNFFKDRFYVQIIKTDGAVPLGQVRKITASTSTGAFTCEAFSATVDTYDEILILHESQLASLSPDLRVGDESGLVYSGVCSAEHATFPLVNAVCIGLAGFGDNFFNDKYFIQIVHNVNSSGASPEAKVRVISDYESLTGTFTWVDSVLNAVEINDRILIIHESLIAPTADSGLDRTVAQTVGNKADTAPDMDAALNATDSVINHLKALRTLLGTTPASPDDPVLTILGQRDDTVTVAATASIVALLRDLIAGLGVVAAAAGGGFEIDGTPNLPAALGTTGAVVTDIATSVLGAIGADNAANAFGSGSVLPDEDGSVLEREEYIQTQLGYGILELIQDAPGGTSTTLIDISVLTEVDDYYRNDLLLCIVGTNAGQMRPVITSDQGTGTLTVFPAFHDAPATGDSYLLISAYKPQIFEQQAAVALTGDTTTLATILDLSAAGFSYMLNSLRLKFATPGVNTITVHLTEFINGLEVEVDTFVVDSTNFGSYHSLMDMFGEHHIAGDNILITVTVSAPGPYAVTGQYQYAMVYTG